MGLINTIAQKMKFVQLLAMVIIVFVFSIFIGVLFGNVKSAVQITSQIITAIISCVSFVMGYYYGSSSGSQKKDAVISNMTQPTAPTTLTINSPEPSSTNDQMGKNMDGDAN